MRRITCAATAKKWARSCQSTCVPSISRARREHDIWIWHLSRETLTRLTFDAANDVQPAWTPDSQHILFGSNRGGTMDLFEQRVDGSSPAERVTTSATALHPQAISRDGRLVVVLDQSNTGNSLSLVTLNGAARIQPVFSRASIPDISPDGRWLAYQSSESGQAEVYVRPFPTSVLAVSGRSLSAAGDGRNGQPAVASSSMWRASRSCPWRFS